MNFNMDELNKLPAIPIAAIAGGILVLLWPAILSYVVALGLIAYGALELFNKK